MKELDLAERLSNAMDAAQVAWWEMELPSGRITFGHNKTDLLGYDWQDFTHYKHFTDLVDPADYEPMMEDMRACMRGDKPVYEALYRIKAKNGQYLQFYDRGKIVERDGEKMRIAGMVINVGALQQFAYKIASEPYKAVERDEQ